MMNPFVLLAISVVLSTGRNLLSKKISDAPFGTRAFFVLQAVIFGSGAAVLGGVLLGEGIALAPLTLVYALLYGMMLVGAQWCYTVALFRGNIAICATVYSLAFMLPTLSGMVFWSEQVTVFKVLGFLTAILALVCSLRKTEAAKAKESYVLPLLLAMLCSGGLGIMQKVQQLSPYPEQRTEFVCIAFCLATVMSLLASFRTEKKAQRPLSRVHGGAAIGIGTCFAICNLLNTYLAGKLDSAIFFPTLNVGAILLSTVIGLIAYKERFSKIMFSILFLGITSILLINLAP